MQTIAPALPEPVDPIQITIPGNFYDSYIYSGTLKLWTAHNSTRTIDWDDFIAEWCSELEPKLGFAFYCAFSKSNHLYTPAGRLLTKDAEALSLLLFRFKTLQKKELVKDLPKGREMNNDFTFPHADVEFHYGKTYVGHAYGLETKSEAGRPLKVWDGPALRLDAKYRKLAIAGGSEGLYQYNTDEGRATPRRYLKHHADSVRWMHASIFGGSYGIGNLAEFKLRKGEKRGEQIREFSGAISGREILGMAGLESRDNPVFSAEDVQYTWGAGDKICFANNRGIQVVKRQSGDFISMGAVGRERHTEGEVIDADSSLFGYVVEFDDGLMVVDSHERQHWLPGEPVNWRVFPDSVDYCNHLHVIYDDRLCIFSFNQDFDTDQEAKRAGVSYEWL